MTAAVPWPNATQVGIHLYGLLPAITLTTVAESPAFACIRFTNEAAIYVHNAAILDRIAEVATRAAAELREARSMAGPVMAEEARR